MTARHGCSAVSVRVVPASGAAVGYHRAVTTFEMRRECRICRCHEADRCFTLEGARLVGKCYWVGPDLCSYCAADGGPRHVSKLPEGPDHFSGLVDPQGNPLRWSRDLPR